jgi:hypothetical protein
MLVVVLAILNIPVYLFLGWLAFDNKDNTADTFFETTVAILKILLVPRIVRALLGMDTEASWGLFPIAGFSVGCALIVWGEYTLIVKWFPGWAV